MRYLSSEHGTLVIAMVEVNKRADTLHVSKSIFHVCSENAYYKEEEINVLFFIENIPRTPSGKILRRDINHIDELNFLVEKINENGSKFSYDIRRKEVINVNV